MNELEKQRISEYDYRYSIYSIDIIIVECQERSPDKEHRITSQHTLV